VDAQPLTVEAVRSILSGLGVEVTVTTHRYEDTVDLLRAHKPDLVVLGVSRWSSDMHELEYLEQARLREVGAKVIILSDDASRAVINAAMRAGAAAYVTKAASVEDLATAVRQVFEPSIFLAAEHPPAATYVEWTTAGMELSRREREILALVASGRSNADIGRALWVTDQTVKFHLSNIYRKLGVANRTEAAMKALQLLGSLTGR
jgi:DNA-binding NarL/FixJ family response regulator